MWCRSVRDDIPGSRGQSGSSSDQGGLGIPSRSAPAPTREILKATFKNALRELEADKDRVCDELWLNLAFGQVERVIRRWRAENPKSRFSPTRLGRRPLLERDVELLRALRAANPGSDCRAEFDKAISVGKQQARIRYQVADKKMAETASKSES
jgi:hypothetical protein